MIEFMETFDVKTNFSEYSSVSIKIKKVLEWKEILLYAEPAPQNSSLNVLLNLSKKGCSKLYSRMKDSFGHVVDNIVDRWKDNTDNEIETSISSFEHCTTGSILMRNFQNGYQIYTFMWLMSHSS